MPPLPTSPGPSWTTSEIRASLHGDIHPAARKGIEAFNRRDFFLAHEELETAWRAEKGPARDVYRGILQIGLGYYHIMKGNYAGAVKMFQRCKTWLAPFPDTYRGIDIARLRDEAHQAEQELIILGPDHIAAFNLIWVKSVVFVE